MMKLQILLAVAVHLGSGVLAQHYGDQYHYDHGPNYEFQYEVQDPYHHDFHGQAESKIGDLVKGHYRLKETDGSTRDVVYTADKHSGFNAVVHKDGKQVFPEIVTKAQYAIPLNPQYRQQEYQQAQYQQPQYQQYQQPQYQQPQYQQYQQPQPHEPLFHYSY